MKPISIAIILLFQVTGMMNLLAQTIPTFTQKKYIDTANLFYWNKNMPVYFFLGTDTVTDPILLKSEKHAEFTNPYYFDREGLNYVKTPYAVDPVTKKDLTPHKYLKFEVYVDGSPPVISLSYEQAPSFKSYEKSFYGNNLSIRISAEDEISGVESIHFSLNNYKYEKYSDTIKKFSEGKNIMSYLSVDNVGNANEVISKEFYLDLSPPTSNHEIKGDSIGYIISTNSMIKLNALDSLSGVRSIHYSISDSKPLLYNGMTIPISNLKDGEYELKYYSTDNVDNTEHVKSHTFYLDKYAPILASDILGDRFIVEDQIYFSGRTKMKLTAVDNKSGVKEVLYSINNGEFMEYKQPFYLPSRSGIHIIKYFAVDKMGNRTSGGRFINGEYEEYTHNVDKIYVDLVGPTISHSYIGKKIIISDTVVINSETRIKFNAYDDESGLNFISYSIDSQKEETTYREPFSIKENGYHTIEYFAYDRVNNRNKGEFSLIVDNDPPEIKHYFSVQPIGSKDTVDIYPSNVLLYISATDIKSGTNEIFYSNNGKNQRKYTKEVREFEKNSMNFIEIKAIDNLDNSSEMKIAIYVTK